MSHLVPFKLKLFLHCCDPIWICKSFNDFFRLDIREKSIESTKIFELGSSLHSRIKVRQNLIKRVQTLVLHGHEVRGSIDMLSTLAWILGETGSQTVLEPILKPIPEPVLDPVSGVLGRFCSKLGSAVLLPVWFRPCPLFTETALGPDPSSGYLPS